MRDIELFGAFFMLLVVLLFPGWPAFLVVLVGVAVVVVVMSFSACCYC